MLPTTMNFKPGSQSSTLAGDVRDGFLTFKISTGAGENAAQVDVVISKVEIKIKHMFLQVCHNCCVCVWGERVGKEFGLVFQFIALIFGTRCHAFLSNYNRQPHPFHPFPPPHSPL